MQPSFSEFREALNEENPRLTPSKIEEIYNTIYGTSGYVTIADTEVPPPPFPYYPGESINQGILIKGCQQEVENTMFDECTPCAPRLRAKILAPMANAQVISQPSVEATQRDYVIERIKAIGEKHARALRVQFNIDPKQPETWNALKAFIDAGEFTVNKEKTNSEFASHYNLTYGVTFGKPKDEVGYKAAKEVLRDAAQKFLDVATLKPLDEAAKAIEDFEGWTL